MGELFWMKPMLSVAVAHCRMDALCVAHVRSTVRFEF